MFKGKWRIRGSVGKESYSIEWESESSGTGMKVRKGIDTLGIEISRFSILVRSLGPGASSVRVKARSTGLRGELQSQSLDFQNPSKARQAPVFSFSSVVGFQHLVSSINIGSSSRLPGCSFDSDFQDSISSFH